MAWFARSGARFTLVGVGPSSFTLGNQLPSFFLLRQFEVSIAFSIADTHAQAG